MSVQTQSMPGILPGQQSPASWLGTSPPKLAEPPRRQAIGAGRGSAHSGMTQPGTAATQAVAQQQLQISQASLEELCRLADGKIGTATCCTDYRLDSAEPAMRAKALEATRRIVEIFSGFFTPVLEETKELCSSVQRAKECAENSKTGTSFMLRFNQNRIPSLRGGRYKSIPGGFVIASSLDTMQGLEGKMERFKNSVSQKNNGYSYSDIEQRANSILVRCFGPEFSILRSYLQTARSLTQNDVDNLLLFPLANAIAVSLGPQFAKKEEAPVVPAKQDSSSTDQSHVVRISREEMAEIDREAKKRAENALRQVDDELAQILRRQAQQKENVPENTKVEEKAPKKQSKLCGFFKGLKMGSKKK